MIGCKCWLVVIDASQAATLHAGGRLSRVAMRHPCICVPCFAHHCCCGCWGRYRPRAGIGQGRSSRGPPPSGRTCQRCRHRSSQTRSLLRFMASTRATGRCIRSVPSSCGSTIALEMAAHAGLLRSACWACPWGAGWGLLAGRRQLAPGSAAVDGRQGRCSSGGGGETARGDHADPACIPGTSCSRWCCPGWEVGRGRAGLGHASPACKPGCCCHCCSCCGGGGCSHGCGSTPSVLSLSR